MSGQIVFNNASTSCATSVISGTYARAYTMEDLKGACGSDKEREPEVRADTKTELKISNNKIYARHYNDGFFKTEKYLIPDISDVKVYHNTVVVFFADNTKTSAVLDQEDKFNLEQGISICITKKLLGENGNSLYNKLMKLALRVKKKNEDSAQKETERKKRQKERMALNAERRRQKKLKKREEQIEIQKEAYLRAMMEAKNAQ